MSTPDPNFPTLLTALAPMIDDYSNTDQEWVTFVIDHIKFIQKNSTILSVDDASRDRYRNKFYQYMLVNKCNPSIIWIASLINNLDLYEDFTTKSTVLIPNTLYINTLYRLYRTSKNNP